MSRSHGPILRILILFLIAHSARGDLGLVGDDLILDAAVWTDGHLLRAEQIGLARNEFVIERAAAPVGITGRLGPVASLRVSADIGTVYPLDLYSGFHWGNGINVCAGQFVLPLGSEQMTDPGDAPIVNSSLLSGYAAPAGNRDIGLMGGVQKARFSLYGAVVNGAGANTADNNLRKDVCGRLTLNPLADVDGTLAVRAYYGWPGAADTAWLTMAAEARLASRPLELQIEAQSHRSSSLRNNAAYVQVTWSTGYVRPAGRFDIVLPQGEHLEWMLTGGLNVEPISNHLKVMLDCTYRRNYQANWSVLGFLFRLQAAI